MARRASRLRSLSSDASFLLSIGIPWGSTLSASDWASLNLLWDRYPNSSHNNMARSLLRAIAEFTVYPSTHTFWRGHSSHEYRLRPGACRRVDPPTQGKMIGAADKLLLAANDAARSWRTGSQYIQLTPLQRLSHLQHHGHPTPLLDMTPDPMIALWMASRPSGSQDAGEADGLLIGFNVDGRWTDVSLERGDYGAIAKRLEASGQVGWLRPPISDDRIVVQRSRMLVSWIAPGRWHSAVSDVWLPDPTSVHIKATGDDARSRIDAVFNPSRGRPSKLPAMAFRIPWKLKPAPRSILENHYGVSRSTLFPDPQGVGVV